MLTVSVKFVVQLVPLWRICSIGVKLFDCVAFGRLSVKHLDCYYLSHAGQLYVSKKIKYLAL